MSDPIAEQVPESVDELGPLDWIVVGFPGKGEDGTLDFYELGDLDESEIGGLRAYEAELATLLSEDDVAAPRPCWCGRAPGRSRSRRPCAGPAGSWWPAGGSQYRLCSPRLRRTRDTETDMPLAARRRRRAGVIGPAPVARTAATVGTAAVVARGVRRRGDRREDRGDRREDRRERRW